MKQLKPIFFSIFTIFWLSGCVVVTVAETAVGVTAAVVEGTVDVLDVVTPDIISDDDDDDDDEENEEE